MTCLVLTRTVDQEVVIGDPINPIGVVRVVSISKGKVRLAFQFNKTVPVNRAEVADDIRQDSRVGDGDETHLTRVR